MDLEKYRGFVFEIRFEGADCIKKETEAVSAREGIEKMLQSEYSKCDGLRLDILGRNQNSREDRILLIT